jgi:septin family protein
MDVKVDNDKTSDLKKLHNQALRTHLLGVAAPLIVLMRRLN